MVNLVSGKACIFYYFNILLTMKLSPIRFLYLTMLVAAISGFKINPCFGQDTQSAGSVVSPHNMTVVNNSNYELHFQIFTTNKNGEPQKVASIYSAVSASSRTAYQFDKEIKWGADVDKNKEHALLFKGYYVDPSGACISYASANLGETKGFSEKQTTINTTKCGGTDLLSLSWNITDGNILVVVN